MASKEQIWSRRFFDVAVVGAGSAGAVIAARLSEDSSRSVLLLEAGPDFPDFSQLPDELKYGFATEAEVTTQDHNWTFQAKRNDVGADLQVPRGRVTGGSSAINGQVFLRGLPEDFDAWVQVGCDRWSFGEVLPHYRQLETDLDFDGPVHGRDGPIKVRRIPTVEWDKSALAFQQAALDLGFDHVDDHNNPGATGVGPTPLNNVDGIRVSTAMGYLASARNRPNLTIQANAVVTRVIIERERARGVEVAIGGRMHEVRAAEVVLCAGAIGSPHLLLLSGVGPAAQINAVGLHAVIDRPGVGRNLRDHPNVFVKWAENSPSHESTSARRPVSVVSLRYTAEGSSLRNDLRVSLLSLGTGNFFPGVRWSYQSEHGRQLWMQAQVLLAAGQGELRLRSADPSVHPLIDYRLLADEVVDRRRLAAAVQQSLQIAERPELKGILGERLEPTDSDLASQSAFEHWMLRSVRDAGHISSTCKMGRPSDELAVVDQLGNVLGIDGIRVADTSIMPDSVRANTNATAIMIGERIASFMKGPAISEPMIQGLREPSSPPEAR